MITYYVTVDIACKGKSEDIANMKKRLTVIRQNPAILESVDKLKELFGEELNEIEADHEQIFNFFTRAVADNLLAPAEVKLKDEENNIEKNCTYTFGGLLYNWEKADIENMNFFTTIKEDPWSKDKNEYLEEGAIFCGKDIYIFTASLEQVFPRIEFNFISYSECKGYEYYAAYENSDMIHDYYYFGNHKEQLDLYLKWKNEYRRTWLMGEKITQECHNLKKALFEVYVDPNYEDSEDYCSIEFTWKNHYN